MDSEDRDKKIEAALKEKSTHDLLNRKRLVERLKSITFIGLVIIAAAVLFFMFKGVDAKKLLPLSGAAFILVLLNWTFSRAARKLMAELINRGQGK